MLLYLATWPPEIQEEQAIGQGRAHAMGMKMHLAETDPSNTGWGQQGTNSGGYHLRILMSYHYYKDTDLDRLFAKYFTKPYPDVFADSGAYSAMTQGKPMDINDYADWIKRWSHIFTTYSNLDVIMDADATWKNQKYMEQVCGLRPLPVFHVLEDFSWLDRYLDEYSYIALGVAGMQQRTGLMPWLIKCFRRAGDKAVFHGFGLTGWKVMANLPWYSVDSTSWSQGFRFGRVPIFNRRAGKFIKLKLGDTPSWQRYGDIVNDLGFDWHDFADRGKNDRAKICAISALSYMIAEAWLRRRHGEIMIPNRTADPGLLLHLADTSMGINYSDAQKGVKIHLADATGTGETGDADFGLIQQVLDDQ